MGDLVIDARDRTLRPRGRFGNETDLTHVQEIQSLASDGAWNTAAVQQRNETA